MTLGTPGEPAPAGTLHSPSDVAVAPNGDIFVADGHGDNGNNRVVQVLERRQVRHGMGEGRWGPGEFHSMHAIAIDSRGRIFVGDRGNNRIQISIRTASRLRRRGPVRQTERDSLRLT